MTNAPERPLPDSMDATDRGADPAPERTISAAPSPEGNDRPEGEPRSLSARDLQENASDEEPLETRPGSDADQAAEAPHVG